MVEEILRALCVRSNFTIVDKIWRVSTPFRSRPVYHVYPPLPFFASPYLPISLFRSTHLERVTLTPHVDPTNFVVETAEKKIRKSQSMKKKILKQMIILHE